jgi:hypothetical protein
MVRPQLAQCRHEIRRRCLNCRESGKVAGKMGERSMGESKVKQRSTTDFILRFPQCSLCGGDRLTSTREHMPPESLFDGKHRPDKLVMPACKTCNGGTSTPDLTASIISRWGMNNNFQSQIDHSKLAAQAKIQAPELVREWLAVDNAAEQLRARDHLERHGVSVPAGAQLATIGPLTIRQLNVFSHKATLALYFEHFKLPLSNDGRVQAIWKTKEDFAKGLPAQLLELMGGYGTLIQGKWNAAEIFEYRYSLNVPEGLFGCFARLRQGLFVLGFAVVDAKTLVETPELDGEWIRPRDLLADNPHFAKRH